MKTHAIYGYRNAESHVLTCIAVPKYIQHHFTFQTSQCFMKAKTLSSVVRGNISFSVSLLNVF